METDMDTKTDAKVVKSDAEWQKQLTPLQFKVARRKGTERAFTGEYHDHHETGIYRCVCCGAELFRSENKFHSGCGWPSFMAPADAEGNGKIGRASREIRVEQIRGLLDFLGIAAYRGSPRGEASEVLIPPNTNRSGTSRKPSRAASSPARISPTPIACAA